MTLFRTIITYFSVYIILQTVLPPIGLIVEKVLVCWMCFLDAHLWWTTTCNAWCWWCWCSSSFSSVMMVFYLWYQNIRLSLLLCVALSKGPKPIKKGFLVILLFAKGLSSTTHCAVSQQLAQSNVV